MTDTTTTTTLDLGTPAPSMVDILTSEEASALIDAIEATEAAPKGKRVRVPRGIQLKNEVPAVEPTKRVKVRNEKRETLPAPSEGKRLTPRVEPIVHVKLDSASAYYRLPSTPKGKALFTYTLAVFTVLGGFTKHRASMDPERITGFFQGKKAVSYHTDNGNLEETSKGVRLSTAGWNYFYGRITGSTVAQKVDQPEVDTLVEALKTGELSKSTARFDKSTKFIHCA